MSNDFKLLLLHLFFKAVATLITLCEWESRFRLMSLFYTWPSITLRNRCFFRKGRENNHHITRLECSTKWTLSFSLERKILSSCRVLQNEVRMLSVVYCSVQEKFFSLSLVLSLSFTLSLSLFLFNRAL